MNPEAKGRPAPRPFTARATMVALGLYVFFGGLVSFAGWYADLPRLTDWAHTGISIQPNTAVVAMASGLAAMLLAWGRRSAAAALGLFVALVGGSVLFEWLSGVDLGLGDLLMFGRSWGQATVVHPGRMGPPGSLSWTMVGAGLFLLATSRPGMRRRTLALMLALVATVIASLSIIGYLFGAKLLYTLPRLTAIAAQTSTFILGSALAIIAALHERPPMRWLTEDSAAGVLARRALPLVVLIPLALGWLRLRGEEMKLYDSAFGVAMFVIALTILLVVVLWWNLATVSRHESILRRSEQRVLDTLESITDGFVTFDDQWRYTMVNAEAEQLLGRTRAALIGRSVWDVFPESSESTGGRELRGAAARRTSIEFDDYNPSLERWFTNKAYPLVDGGVAVYFQDITERKTAEKALQASREQLDVELADLRRLQELSLRMVQAGDVESLLGEIVAASASVTHTPKGSIQFFDPASGRLRIVVHQGLGPRLVEHYSEDGPPPMSGRAAAALERVIVEDVATDPALQGTADRELLLADGIRATLSTPLVTRGGDLLGVLDNHFGAPRRPTDRELRYLDVLARMAADLIERSRIEEALRDANRRKDEFLAILAHELRNPLAPIRNSAHYLRLRSGDDTELRRPLEMIERQIEQMARLIDDLLDVSRITRGQTALRLEAVDFSDIAETVLDSSRAEIAAGGHRLHVDLPAGPVPLWADRHRLAQVFSNLIVNAVRYTPPGGRIAFTAAVHDGMLEVSVQDDGVGIPRERLSEIFELFTQLNRSPERHGGLGIGLTLARQLVLLHHGTIEAKSDGPGHGSTFDVRLPLAPAQAAPRETVAPPEPKAAPRRILIADDNVDVGTSLAMILERGGHDVRVATDGAQALAIAEEFEPEVAFLDIGMPEMNGYDVARRLRESPWGRRAYLVAVTGWGEEDNRRRSREVGFDAHVVKPASPAVLERMLAELEADSTATGRDAAGDT